MKNVILHYPSNKTYKEHKFKVAETDLGSILRKRISAELPSFKDDNYLLILKKYDNYLSFLQEDKPFNKILNENRIHIQLVIPPLEAEFLLPNQSVIHKLINLTETVSENIKDLFSFIQETDNSYSALKKSEDFIFESFTFIFTPNNSVSDGFEDNSNDSNNNDGNVNCPKIVSSALPLLFQGWSGERLTLIRRITSIDLLIADEKWKKREIQIQKMKQSFEDIKNDKNNKRKTVNFQSINDDDESRPSVIEKSKSISNFELKNPKNDALLTINDNNDHNLHSQATKIKGNESADEIFFDFTTEEFFYNCQLSVLNKLCFFDLNVWGALACLQCIASHANLKHTQVTNLLLFIPDSVQNAAKETEQNFPKLTDILNEMKHKYSKYERMQAMRTYIRLCVEKGESFCYSEDVKFLILTKKWRVSSHRIIYISSNKISIAKDENSLTFLYQSNISDIVGVSFDGDFIIITFEIYVKNNDQENKLHNSDSLSVQMEKWRIKSHHPQIIINMINELRSTLYQLSHTLSNLPGSPPSLTKVKSTDFRNLASAINRTKSSGMLRNFLHTSNCLKKVDDKTTSNVVNTENLSNENDSILIQSDFIDKKINDFYFDNIDTSIENDSDFVEPGISKLICSSKEESEKICSDSLFGHNRKLKLLKKLFLPYKIDNLTLNSENSALSLNSYFGLDTMSGIPDINWILDFGKNFSFSHKNGKIIIVLGILIIFLFVFAFFK